LSVVVLCRSSHSGNLRVSPSDFSFFLTRNEIYEAWYRYFRHVAISMNETCVRHGNVVAKQEIESTKVSASRICLFSIVRASPDLYRPFVQAD
jgi:hypothetical protein